MTRFISILISTVALALCGTCRGDQQRSLIDLHQLGLSERPEQVRVFVEEVQKRLARLPRTEPIDTEFTDMLYALRSIPDTGVTFSYDEALWSRKQFVIQALAEATGYANTVAPLKRDPENVPPVDALFVETARPEGQRRILAWYRDVFSRGRVIREFHTVEDQDGEQAGSGQPATRPESESEGGDKPQPEAEGRSR
jgi:hypothetical protein